MIRKYEKIRSLIASGLFVVLFYYVILTTEYLYVIINMMNVFLPTVLWIVNKSWLLSSIYNYIT